MNFSFSYDNICEDFQWTQKRAPNFDLFSFILWKTLKNIAIRCRLQVGTKMQLMIFILHQKFPRIYISSQQYSPQSRLKSLHLSFCILGSEARAPKHAHWYSGYSKKELHYFNFCSCVCMFILKTISNIYRVLKTSCFVRTKC